MSIASKGDQNRIKWFRTQVIGQGTFGTCVYNGEFKNFPVAVKRGEKSGFVKVHNEFIQEHITRPKHPNIIQYFAFTTDQDFWFVSLRNLEIQANIN